VTVTGVTLGGADAGNYTVSQPSGLSADITAKNLTITGAVAQNKEYNGSNAATVDFTSAVLVGVVAPDAVTIDSTGYAATFADEDVGTWAVTVTGVTLGGADAGNYTVSQPSGLSADITAKNLTITGAVAQNKEYNGSNAATVDFTSAVLVGVVAPDAVTIDSTGYAATFADEDVGTWAVTVTGVTLGGADAGNYTVSQPSGLSADITAKNLTITGAVAQNKEYNGSNAATVDFTSAVLVGVVAPDAVTIDSTGYAATFADEDVGTWAVTVTGGTLGGADAGNYTVSQPSGLSAHITAKNLTITGAVAQNKEYNGSNAATVDFTSAVLVGVVAPDAVTIDSTGYAATFADEDGGPWAVAV